MTRRGLLTSAAIAAVMAGCVSGRSFTEKSEADFPPTGQFRTIEGLRMHYVDVGEGQPIVLIHGASGNLRDWTFSMVDRLKRHFRVIAIDRPGHGYSDRPQADGANPETQARLLAALTKSLTDDPVIVVGHSWGGAVATSWGLNAPEQVAGMVILAGATHPWGGDGGFLYSAGASPVGGAVAAVARTYVSGARAERALAEIFTPNPVRAGYAEHIGIPLALRPNTFRWNAEDIDRLNDHLARISKRYHMLKMPIAILHGDADETVIASLHAERLVRDVEKGSLHILSGIGHMPQHVAEDIVFDAILNIGENI